MRRCLLLFLLVSFSFWFPTAYKRWTHAFRPAKCLVQWPFAPEWEIEALSSEKEQEIRDILSEPFSYFAKGAQSYVFLSHDQKYVLKLFRFDTCRIPFGQASVRLIKKWIGAREKHSLPTEVKIAKNFTSCKLAYSLAQKQTGTVFVHLNPKGGFPILILKDRLGRNHKIDPAMYRFVLQRKAEPFLQTFYANRNDLQPFINSYLTLLHELAVIGFVNLDPTFGRNFGFLDGRAVQIDLGNFVYCPERSTAEVAYFEQQLRCWLDKRIPEAAHYTQTH